MCSSDLQLTSVIDVDTVEAEAGRAKEAGMDAVPCFIFGGLIAIRGAQSPDYLAQAIERAAEETSRRVAAEQLWTG